MPEPESFSDRIKKINAGAAAKAQASKVKSDQEAANLKEAQGRYRNLAIRMRGNDEQEDARLIHRAELSPPLRVAEEVREGGTAVDQQQRDGKDRARKDHPDVAEKIIGSVVVDAHHTTEDQLLAQARKYYAQYNRDTR